MMKTYDESFTILTRDCDMKGTWRLSAVLEAMQEAAGSHSLLLGCGREDLLKKNAVWVLSRSEIHMNRYPRAGEKITVHTFPMPTRICFFPRYYIFTDDQGETVGKAGTLWLLLDTITRKMLPPGDVARLIPDNRDLAVPMKLPATVGNLQGEEFVTEYTPVYTDLDVNGHVNNARYADWLCNTLGIEQMKNYEPETVIFNYNHEILPGQKIILHRIQKDMQYRLAGYLGETVAFEIGGILRKTPII
jgi:acyl-ACP thioesterase